MLIFLIFLYSYQNTLINAEEVHWEAMHKTDYDIIPHRIEVIYFNESYGQLTKCELVKYNRTYQRTLNASGTLIKEIDKKRLVAHVQIYKFTSNTYKFFPITVEANVCQEYERNSFDLKSAFNLYTNIRSCPPKLVMIGFLYGTNVPMDSSKLPPFIPRGDYKNKMEIYNRDDKVVHLELYGSVVNKPKIWK